MNKVETIMKLLGKLYTKFEEVIQKYDNLMEVRISGDCYEVISFP